MNVRASKRFAAAAAPLVVAGLVMSSCGGSDDANTKAVISLGESPETNYQTLPPSTAAPVDSAPTDSTPVSGGGGAAATEYTIQAGDTTRIGVANKFGVSVEDMDAANAQTDGYSSFYPGLTIIIPAGGTAPTESGGGGTETDGTEDPVIADTIPESGDNCAPGSYTIEAGDSTRIAVAEKFDVSVADLDAANANTDGYSGFYPGLKIIIPAKDC